MAPEVVLGQPYNEKVDVFSFGVILFEVLNRKLMLVDEIKNDPRKDAQVMANVISDLPEDWVAGGWGGWAVGDRQQGP
jgi:serine/threonine protein kinase